MQEEKKFKKPFDKRKAKRKLYKFFYKDKEYSKNAAYFESKDMVERKYKEIKHFNKLDTFLKKYGLINCALKIRNNNNDEAVLFFNITENKTYDDLEHVDLILTNKPEYKNEIDINKLELANNHLICAMNSKIFEEDKTEDVEYMKRILLNNFLFSLLENSGRTLKALEKQVKNNTEFTYK